MLTVPAGALLGLAIGKERLLESSPKSLSLGLAPTRGGIRVVGLLSF